jgi:tricorn protease
MPLHVIRLAFLALALSQSLTMAVAAEPQGVDPDRPLWLRHPAVSPDGTQIAFAYAGQIWIVPAGGGEAIALTDGNFYSTAPVWSPDSKRIAFASTRYGNDDVFVMPVAGGEIKRLTYHSADDIPMAFSPDGAEIYFSSPRLGDATATGLDRCVGSARC